MEEQQVKDEAEDMPVAGASASDTFCRTMCDMICQKDVVIIQSMQTEALSKFEKTNEKFDNFNRLSAERYNRLHNHFQNHTKMLIDMKKDLDVVFRRIRNLKTKLTKQYGEAFMVTSNTIHKLEEELEVEAAHTEEKPQKESQQFTNPNSTSNIKHTETGTEQQNLSDAHSTGGTQMSASIENITIQKSMEQTDSQQSRAVYTTKLKPQLSTSDESYGTSDNDEDENVNRENQSQDGDDNLNIKSKQNENTTSTEFNSGELNNATFTTQDVTTSQQFSSSDESLESDSSDKERNISGNDENKQPENKLNENES